MVAGGVAVVVYGAVALLFGAGDEFRLEASECSKAGGRNMFFGTYAKEVVSAVVPFLVWLLTYLTKAKTKLQYATPH